MNSYDIKGENKFGRFIMVCDLSSLSNVELETNLSELTGNEREVTLRILHHLAELDKRKCFIEVGYSSLFDYCTRKLKYSEASAARRIAGARAIVEFLELEELFINGEVSLCTIATAANSLRARKTKVSEIIGKSAREVRTLVFKEEAYTKPKERVTEVQVKLDKQVEERVSIKFSLHKEVYKQFEEVRARLSNKLGSDLSVEAVFGRLLSDYLKASKLRGYNQNSRYIPKALKDLVYKKSKSQCSFKAADGTPCTERHHLHIDHIVPFAAGGLTELDNLRLLCPAHNKLLAEKYFGQEFIAQKIAA